MQIILISTGIDQATFEQCGFEVVVQFHASVKRLPFTVPVKYWYSEDGTLNQILADILTSQIPCNADGSLTRVSLVCNGVELVTHCFKTIDGSSLGIRLVFLPKGNSLELKDCANSKRLSA